MNNNSYFRIDNSLITPLQMYGQSNITLNHNPLPVTQEITIASDDKSNPEPDCVPCKNRETEHMKRKRGTNKKRTCQRCSECHHFTTTPEHKEMIDFVNKHVCPSEV